MSLYETATFTSEPLVQTIGAMPDNASLANGIGDLESVSYQIFDTIMRVRRTPEANQRCDSVSCKECQGQHLDKIRSAVVEGRPILFVLPAFPGKSPNLQKVLGTLPDKAEELALEFLNDFCARIQRIYSPGARITLCSDGRVFSDVVGINESDISSYQAEIKQIISRKNLNNLSVFSLDDIHECSDFETMREQLMARYGESLAALRQKILMGRLLDSRIEEREALRMYQGMVRFLNDDMYRSTISLSRTQIQKDSKRRAMDLILRSNAWSRLIAEVFPAAVRLSIHPQGCGSSKIGIRLIKDEVWMTPWHGVAVETSAGHILMKRWEAEQRGARLILNSFGQASHYQLNNSYS
jgi:pyoverdine/dityrosine biosynthesis protein Dit1